ncbi:EAL domain-containing protein [Marinobacter sp. SS21]|uniref:EAL domain-containing protein n=1 Tax=Marinobacter sp. SS21 TaxID=2979460 RepID=UPI00232C2E79|nr:EAL domain-containing protein [Marinobacter sp. SS21]MDC0663771.1 EAL domain-containing protein [Marinobacter sp. SS21]
MQSDPGHSQTLQRLLLVSECEHTILQIKGRLDGYSEEVWTVCRGPEAGLQALNASTFDAMLVGLNDPGQALRLVRQARANGDTTPAVLVTHQSSGELTPHLPPLEHMAQLSANQLTEDALTQCLNRLQGRRRYVDQLIHSEACFRTLFEANPQPMCLMETQSERIVALNQAAKALYWLPSLHAADLYLGNLRIDNDAKTPVADALLAGYRPPEDCELERHRRRDGALLYVEVFSQAIPVARGSLTLLMMTDVSDRIMALNKARSSEQAYLNLLGDMRDGALVVDGHQRLCYSNPASETLLGPELKDFYRLVQHLSAIQPGHALEVKLDQDHQSPRWLEILSTPIHWRGFTRTLLSLRDISERKRTDEQLQLLQRSIDVCSNGVVIATGQDKDYGIIYGNPAFERITGYTVAEAIGRDCRTLLDTDSESPNRKRILEALSTNSEFRGVLRNFRRDGSPFWNEFYLAPVPDETGQASHYVGIINDISEHKQAQSDIAFNASHDVLTGLPNRSPLADRIEQALNLIERHRLTLAVLLLNLDHFKLVNDSFGLRVGDQLLKAVAERLQSVVRPGDTVARLGGDEFAILLPDLAAAKDAVTMVDKILSALAQPYQIEEHTLHITTSIGIAVSHKRLANAMDLVQQADMAMLGAKQSGKNTYHWFSAHLRQEANKRAALRNNLERAIAAQHLQLLYQPQVSCQTGKYIGSEALIRWQDPDQGLMLPAEFIPVLEETGQIIRLGQWILERACHDNRVLIESGLRDHTVSVNVSSIQLQQSGFPDMVQAALEASEMPAGNLILEVTESVLLGDSSLGIKNLQTLRQLGVGIVIDDFGKGYSSLSYLKELPATKLKITREFIKSVISDRKDASITKGIISLAHHLGLPVVIVGVESEAQAIFLKRNQCDVLQGQFFSHPLPLSDLTGVLRSGPPSLSTPKDPQARPTLLILDDEPNIIRALSRLLRRDGYRILATTEAQEAFQLLAENDVQVIISDQRMPEISGTEFFSQVKDIYPGTIRIVLSGFTDLESVTDAINEGAIYKFLTKPWEDDQLRQNIREAFIHQSVGQTEQPEPSHD